MSIPSLLVLSIQITLSFVVFSLITFWYVLPWLSTKTKKEQIIALLWVHVFRYTPLLLLAHEQTPRNLPSPTVEIIAYGDLLSSILAISTLIMLQRSNSVNDLMVWVFSIVSAVDIISALSLAMGTQLYEYELGVNWFILVLYVPLVVLSQILIFNILLKQNK